MRRNSPGHMPITRRLTSEVAIRIMSRIILPRKKRKKMMLIVQGYSSHENRLTFGDHKKSLCCILSNCICWFCCSVEGLFVKCSAIIKATVCTKVQNTAFSTNGVSDVLKQEYTPNVVKYTNSVLLDA